MSRKENNRRIRILIIGSLPPPIGGTTVLLQQLVDYLNRDSMVDLAVINISKARKASHIRFILLRLTKLTCRVFLEVAKTDVVCAHVALSSLHISGPVIIAISHLFGKPLLLRIFGGVHYLSLQGKKRTIARWVIKKADLYLAESKKQIRLATEDGVSHSEWFSNSRPMIVGSFQRTNKRKSCRRFVFISHVKQSKGILEIIEAAERFEPSISVDVYGPFYDGISEGLFTGCKRICYKGIVPPDKVVDILSTYDALLLPTYYSGEGYPGIILEAYSVGLPVICTSWKVIPEIVDARSGILIEPRNSEALYKAMRTLAENSDLYKRLCRGAFEKSQLFCAQKWTNKFIGFCQKLTLTKKG